MLGSAFVAAREVRELPLRMREPASRRDAAEPLRQFTIVGSGFSSRGDRRFADDVKNRLRFIDLKDYTVDTGSVLKPDLVIGAGRPDGSKIYATFTRQRSQFRRRDQLPFPSSSTCGPDSLLGVSACSLPLGFRRHARSSEELA
jgi:hypothetical protein